MTTATLSKSTRKDKKWMVRYGNRTTHFGSANMRDFTLLNNKSSPFYEPDKSQREKIKANYRSRHSKDPINTPFTPGSLSYYLLWDKPSLKSAVKAYNKRFNVSISLK